MSKHVSGVFHFFPFIDAPSSWTNGEVEARETWKRLTNYDSLASKVLSSLYIQTLSRLFSPPRRIESNFGVWSQLHTENLKNLCSWQHWNVMNFLFCKWELKCFKTNLFGKKRRRRRWMMMKGKKRATNINDFSTLVLPVYIHHGLIVHKKHVFRFMFLETHIRTGFSF